MPFVHASEKFKTWISADDEYITHATASKPHPATKPEKQFLLLLTQKCLFKFNVQGDQMLKCSPISDLLQVDEGLRATDLQLYEYMKVSSKSASNVSAPGFMFPQLRKRVFCFADADTAFDFVTLLKRLVTRSIQKHYETTLFRSSEIFQCICFVSLINEKGCCDNLMFVLSSERLYLFDYKPGSKKVQDAMYVCSLRGSTTYSEIDKLAMDAFHFASIAITFTSVAITALGLKDSENTFYTLSAMDKALLCADLQRLKFQTAKEHLSPEAFDDVNVIGQVQSEIAPKTALDILEKGRILLKFGKFGDPHLRYFRLDAKMKKITWETDKKKSHESCVNLQNLGQIVIASKTSAIDKFKLGNVAHLSLILKMEGGARGLETICMCEEDFELWLAALTHLTGAAVVGAENLSVGRHLRVTNV